MIDTELKTNSISSEFTASEQRVVFRNISWSAYEQILSALGQILKSTLHLHSIKLEILYDHTSYRTSSKTILSH